MPSRALIAGLALVAGLLLAPTAEGQPKPAGGDVASPAAQARADRTRVPLGLGSVFVPRLLRGKSPPVLAFVGRKIVAVGDVGRRLVLRPGRYEIAIGSGPQAIGGVRETVEIVAGTTVLLRPSWGALRVQVVNRGGKAVASGYELFNGSGQTSLGLGFGVDDDNRTPKVWLLRPGRYRVVPPGVGGAASSALSVNVARGAGRDLRLTVNRDGSFVGAERDGQAGGSRWTHHLILGVDGSVTHSSAVVGIPDQVFVTGAAFLQAQLAYRQGWHALSLGLEAEAGLALIDPTGETLPLLKNRDRARLTASYGLLLGSWIGPYVRGFAETRLFETRALFSQARTLSVRRLDGSVRLQNISANETFRQTEAFAPTILQGGAGAALRILRMKGLWLSARAGLANRYNVFRSTLANRDVESTPELEYVELDNFNQLGAEATLKLDWKLNGWVSLISDLELFAEFDKLDEPVIEWRNTLAVRLTRHLSINYTLNLLRQPQIVDATQIQQYASLRASLDLL